MYIRVIVQMNNGILPCPNKCWKQPLSGSIKSSDIQEKSTCVKCFSNAIIIPSSDTPLTSSRVSIANDTSCQAKDMDCCLNGKCSLGRSCDRLNWTVDSQSQQQKG